jgi:putative addiction module component (TIGR02574 family)
MNELLVQALRLPESERASMARQLLLSLEPEEPDCDVEAAWALEIEARANAIDQGRFSARDWREALAGIRQTLSRGSAK